MSEIERLALALAILAAQVAQLADDVQHLRCEVLDCKDVYRNCMCFGIDQTEVP